MQGSLKLFTIKGITVYLHYTFLAFVIGLIILYIASGMSWVQLSWSVLFLFGIFASIIIHEYGHAFVASMFGIMAKKITLYPIGGVASIEKLPESPRQELLISGAGPVVSFALAALLFIFSPKEFSWASLEQLSGDLSQGNFLFSLAVINVVLGLFNLIPAFPMDGGRMLRALLAFRLNYIQATAIAAQVGRVFAFIFIAIGLFTVNFLLALIGVFIIFFAKAEESYLQINELVKDLRLKDILLFDYDHIEADTTINEAADLLQHNQARNFVVMQEGYPVGTLNRREVIKAVSRQQYDTPLTELMDEMVDAFEADLPVKDVLTRLAEHENRIFPVFEEGKFVGVVSFQHLIEYLLISRSRSRQFEKTRQLAELV